MSERQPARWLHTEMLGESATFTEALEQFGADAASTDAIGFAYTPYEACWFRRDGDRWVTRDGSAIPIGAFEIRAFSEGAELRWWRTTGLDRGKAVILSEVGTPSTGDTLFRLGDVRALLLWGRATQSAGDWTNLAEGRIGDVLWVPAVDVPPHATVSLLMADYAQRDEHGNVAVAEQRLVGITATTSQPREQ